LKNPKFSMKHQKRRYNQLKNPYQNKSLQITHITDQQLISYQKPYKKSRYLLNLPSIVCVLISAVIADCL
jgi:hypothetical protein